MSSNVNALDVIRDKTKTDLNNKLNMYGRCALVRCTGFGKTWILSDITRQYKNVLYLYPSEVIKNTVVGVLEQVIGNKRVATVQVEGTEVYQNIQFMTYMKLIRLNQSELKAFKDFDLIIFDECHRIGADRTSNSVRSLLRICKDSKFIGATATPERVDAFDVVGEFFNNIVTYEYTLHDAFQDGIIQKPYYAYMTYDIETDLKEAALIAGQDINNIMVKQVLKGKLIEISNIYNMENNIKNAINEWALRIHKGNKRKASNEMSYMKFIVFFNGLTQLDNKQFDVISWFSKAFPKHIVNTLTISSRNRVESENVNRLDELVYRENTIDLILCVDMLNMGYHVNDITGVVMYRGTSSSIVYIQQLGRALSTGSNRPCIVIDVVDNLHRKNVFNINPKEKRRRIRKISQLPDGSMTEGKAEYEQTSITIDRSNITPTEDAELKKLIKRFNNSALTADEQATLVKLVSKLKMTDANGLELNNVGAMISALIADNERWWQYCNNFKETDLIAFEHEATYRELIAKTVAEPIAQRCRRAQEEHYRRWCIMNNTPYPSTKKELTDKDLMPPLQPYAAWQNVTVSQILDTMGIA